MVVSRKRTLSALLRGLLAAVAVTLVLMLAVAALIVLFRISDRVVLVLNQVLKLSSILVGCLVAIGRGGERGFFTGMALSILYMALGYAMYVGLGGNAFSVSDMLAEILIGAAVGAIAGAVLANMSPRGRRARMA